MFVVIILGLLAATALPRFIDVTDEAREASVEGVAGGFAAAVGLVRAQWEVEGRSSGNGTVITYDQTQVGVDGTIGYPTGSSTGNTLISTVIFSQHQQTQRRRTTPLLLISDMPFVRTTQVQIHFVFTT